MNLKYLFVIPARTGSKRCPDKNFKTFVKEGNLSLVELAGMCVKHSEVPGNTIISSDNPLLLINKEKRFEAILHHRGPELSRDEATAQSLAKKIWRIYGYGFNAMIWIQPTSPLRLPKDIRAAVDLFELTHQMSATLPVEERRKIGVVSVTSENGKHNVIHRGGRLFKNDPGEMASINGAIYIVPPSRIYSGDWIEGARPLFMPMERSIDIDTEEEFIEAQARFELFNKVGS